MGKSGVAIVACVFFAFATQLSAASPAASLQSIYNDAQSAFDRGDWKPAIAGFEHVLGASKSQKPSRSQALIRARLAEAYLRDGNTELARSSASAAMGALGPDDRIELANAWMTLGDAARSDLAMPAAIDAYRHAIELSATEDTAPTRTRAQIDIALAAMVTDPNTAAAALDTLLADQRLVAGLPKTTLAQIEALRGRAETNRGDPRAAVRFFSKAIIHSGGLTGLMVNLPQVAIRGDAAIAYQLLHDDDRTHQYITRTGAGHLKSEDWTKGAKMDTPDCGGQAGLRPDDTAVVEFAIADDGKVLGATPVYASRPGTAGIEFAKAVRKWRWDPAAVAQLDPFWRSSIRMQIRCHDKPVGLREGFLDAATAWLAEKGVSEADIEPLKDRTIAATDSRLDRDDLVGVAAIIARAQTADVSELDASLDARLEHALDKAAAPAEVRALALLAELPCKGASYRSCEKSRAASLAAKLPAFETAWPHSRAAAWLRFEYATILEAAGDLSEARPQLETVLAYSASILPQKDPIRQLAVLHLAALENHDGDRNAAMARISDAGIPPDQCSLMNVEPVPTNLGVVAGDFPSEAQRWNFEGFARAAFDISSDGHVVNARTVLAYPPFIFDEAAEKAVSRFRFLPPNLAGAPASCAGQTLNINFRLPNGK